MRSNDELLTLHDLVDVALAALPRMRDPRTGLYSHKTWLSSSGDYVNSAANALYSGAAVVGLLSAQRAGWVSDQGGSVVPSLDALHRLASSSVDPAFLAVLAWGSSLAGDSRRAACFERLVEVLDPRSASSMEVGLALTAASVAANRGNNDRDRMVRLATTLMEELCDRYAEQGQVFKATARSCSPRSLPMSQMSSFASQVYPIHGLCEYARALSIEPASEVGSVCRRLCSAQGPLGQWWWFYSTKRRFVVEGYPVYAVHQDAMAFMALAAAERVGQGSYKSHLSKGLSWVYGNNELRESMVSRKPAFIYRAIQRHGGDPDGRGGWSTRQLCGAMLASLAGGYGEAAPRRDSGRLELLRECRSYHLGWLLYAATLVDTRPLPTLQRRGEEG